VKISVRIHLNSLKGAYGVRSCNITDEIKHLIRGKEKLEEITRE
jgi:hypothetical protein